MQRWSYIYKECRKRGITVVSHGADGDSREVKSMKASCRLFFDDPKFSQLSPSYNIPVLKIPKEWSSWFILKNPTNISFVQDTVHLPVKLKCRLLKPSIVLPLGNYTAGSHHLNLIYDTFNKDQHGMRLRDINSKDRQNYDAVVHLTSNCIMQLLSQIPDALGTRYYLDVLKDIIDSYLDRELPRKNFHH